MRVLFIIPDHEVTRFRDSILLGIATLISLLKKKGHEIALLNFSMRKFDKKELKKSIINFKPQLVGISVLTSHLENQTIEISRIIKSVTNIPLIAGGLAVTANPNRFIMSKYIDFVCIGEGEKAILELIEKLEKKEDYSNIANLWVKKKTRIIRNELNNLISNLDKIPFPDRSLFPKATRSKKKPIKEFVLMAGRGCPYNCSYCINNVLKNMYKGKGPHTRLRSVFNLLAEIKYVKKEYNPKSFYFYDDNFISSIKWVKKFSQAYIMNKINTPFSINTRVETIQENTVSLLRRAGLYEIRFGIESGDDKIRNEILDRTMVNKQIKNAIKILNKLKINYKIYSLIGIPGEDKNDIIKTILLNIRYNPKDFQYHVFQPYPSTKIFEFCKNKNYLIDDISSIKHCNSESIISTPKLTPRDIKIMSSIAYFISYSNKLFPRLFKHMNDGTMKKLINFFYKLLNFEIFFITLDSFINLRRNVIEVITKYKKV